ncbi:MAG: FkbM family methyltransferase [Vicinamibacterales bacterium]
MPYHKNDLVVAGLLRGTFEPEEQHLMRTLLPYCRGMVDVGANLGLYALLASRLMPPNAPIAAFEASPIEYAKLAWTIHRNQLANVQAVAAAASDKDGRATIHQSLSGAGALNRLDRAAKSSGQWEQVEVPMLTLDTWAGLHPGITVDLLKIDVEGHELPVLMGADDLIRRFRPVVLIEVNAARASERSTPSQIWDYLAVRGYRWFAIDEGKAQVRQVTKPGDCVNYLAAPVEPLANARLNEALSGLLLG